MTPLHRAVSVALVVAVACTATATEQNGSKAANPNNAAMDFEKRLKGNELAPVRQLLHTTLLVLRRTTTGRSGGAG